MEKEIYIIKDIYKLEKKIKECINQKKPIPKNILAVLDEASYSVNALSQIVKVYRVSYE